MQYVNKLNLDHKKVYIASLSWVMFEELDVTCNF